VNEYRIRFSAQAPGDLEDDAADRLRRALDTMPGTVAVHGATHDADSRTVTGEFRLEVEHGMAAAARDSSRFAKEALKAAGLRDAQLVELWIALRGQGPGA
jgi:hypothetical protein